MSDQATHPELTPEAAELGHDPTLASTSHDAHDGVIEWTDPPAPEPGAPPS